MSWQIVTFAGLALVLVGGFAWYERTRPSARVVALVAALAALAVAGRLVLAPIPNVVATTDIALITGYALGGAPGFAVGALAAPISNIWLGQGPWTAWQMAAWGLVGLGGAWLAAVSRRRLSRLSLASACAAAGFAFGALLDLSVMVTYGGEQSLDRYLALSARGLPFNVVHAAGNFAIALAAGPALVRMISRFRTRLEFSWPRTATVPLLLVAALLSAAAAAGPGAAEAEPGTRSAEPKRAPPGLSWLIASQNADGGFAATPGQPSSPAMTGWVMLGLEAADRNPLDVRRGGETPVDYLRAQVGRLRSVGDLERTILALAGAGIDPRRFAGTDLVAELRGRRDGDGSVDGQVNLTAFYALAMRAGGADPAALGRSARWLRKAQNADGGWGIQPQAPSEADSTGAALQSLVAAGSSADAARAGAGWLRKSQGSGGGYALGSSGVVNSQSTAWAVQGLAAVSGGGGAEVDAALAYLSRLQAADGHYRYSGSSDQTPVWVTAQVLLATERQPLPLPPVAREPRSSGAGSSAPAGGPEAATTPVPQPSQDQPAANGGDGSSNDSREDGPRSGSHRSGATESEDGSAGSNGPASSPESAPTLSADAGAGTPPTSATATADPPVSAGGDSVAPYVIGGIAALAAALVGGFLWYRRGLP